MLMPSTITALRTRRYTSTWNIHRTIHGLRFEPMDGGGRYNFQPPNVSGLSARMVHFDSAFYIIDTFRRGWQITYIVMRWRKTVDDSTTLVLDSLSMCGTGRLVPNLDNAQWFLAAAGNPMSVAVTRISGYIYSDSLTHPVKNTYST